MKVIVVANRLPATIKVHNNSVVVTQSSGGLVSALKGVKSLDAVWVGWPGCAVSKGEEPLVREECERCNTQPVFLSEKTVELYYNGYCNSVLWPILHYVEDTSIFDEKRMFEAYVEANHKFAGAVADVIATLGDTEALIWVHDYHLMLVPEILRGILPRHKIGFFLHTTFPHPCMWRRITHASQLLRGILHSDLIGVHIYEYKKNLMRSAQELVNSHAQLDIASDSRRGTGALGTGHVRLSNSEIDATGIGLGVCSVIALPIGIDKDHFKLSASRSEQKGSAMRFKNRYGGRKIILGVDRLDYMKGIYQKLRGYQRFIAKYPKLARETVLLQLAVPSRGDVAAYQYLKKQCHRLVAEINGGHQPVQPGGADDHAGGVPGQKVYVEFWDASVHFKQLLNLYMASNVCLISSVRDGMNLVASEYIATCSEGEGALCMSQFVGADRSLGVATVSFNPWDPDSLADALEECLTLSEVDRMRRNQYGKTHVQTFSADRWASTFIDTLRDVPPPAISDPQMLRSPSTREATRELIKSRLSSRGPNAQLYIIVNLAAYYRELQLPRIGATTAHCLPLNSAEVFPLPVTATNVRILYICDNAGLLEDLEACKIVPHPAAAVWSPGSASPVGLPQNDPEVMAELYGKGSKWGAVCETIEAKTSAVFPEIRAVSMGNHVMVYTEEASAIPFLLETLEQEDDFNVLEISDRSLCVYSAASPPSIPFIDQLSQDANVRLLLVGVDVYTEAANTLAIHSRDRAMYLGQREDKIYVRALTDAMAALAEVLAF